MQYDRYGGIYDSVNALKRGFISVAVVAVILAGVTVVLQPGLSIQIASGATSQYICTQTFVSGLKSEGIYAQDVLPEPAHVVDIEAQRPIDFSPEVLPAGVRPFHSILGNRCTG